MSAAGTVGSQTETCRSHLRRTVRSTQGGSEEDPSVPDGGGLRMAGMTGWSLLHKIKDDLVYCCVVACCLYKPMLHHALLAYF